MRLFCGSCRKSVTNELPDDSVFRATALCPECIEDSDEECVENVFQHRSPRDMNSPRPREVK